MRPLADPVRRDRLYQFAGAVGLVAAVFVAYLPAVHGRAVWDDDYMIVNNPVMTEQHGLWRALFDPRAMAVYYPLTDAALWAECRFFGPDDLTGYHVVNTLLHGANAVLLWRLLRRLAVPGAFAAAALWGLHPVCVESVAWVTEHKNTLSGLMYLTSIWAVLRYYGVNGPPSARPGVWYVAAVATFALALAAKTTAVTLPAAALLVVWWKAGRIRPGQVWAAVPFLALAVAAGTVTQHVETTITGTWRPEWGLTRPQQVLVAGRALWFYAAKVAWPAGLSFIYPRWHVDPGAAWQWVFPVAAVAVVGGLWAARRRLGRGPVTGVLFFAGTLVPALGFFHVLFQRYSFVADHFQYLAAAGLVVTASAAVARTRVPWSGKVALFAAVAVALAVATARSSRRFTSDAAAWGSALNRDPTNRVAALNYASALVLDRHFDPAVVPLQLAWTDPDLRGPVWTNLGIIAEAKHDNGRALDCYREAARIQPLDGTVRMRYGTALLVLTNQSAAAADELSAAVALTPDRAGAHDTLGVCLLHLNRPAEAAAEFRRAGQLDPSLPLLSKHLAEAAAAGG